MLFLLCNTLIKLPLVLDGLPDLKYMYVSHWSIRIELFEMSRGYAMIRPLSPPFGLQCLSFFSKGLLTCRI